LGKYDDLLIEMDKDINNIEINTNNDININTNINTIPFNINKFIDELSLIDRQNINNRLSSNMITGYAISSDCIMYTVKRILNIPVENIKSAWLPILMRSTLGNAVHDFIQKNTKQFTECEVSLKVPSIRLSCRLDALINSNILIEIKSCSYEDYAKIVKKQQPRENDWIQVLLYKYLLENYLDEIKSSNIKTRTAIPKLNKYDINYIQFIYIAHDICSSETDNISQSIKLIKTLRKQLESKNNPFCFITVLDLDLIKIDISDCLNYIKEKIEMINFYVNNNKLPDKDNKFIDKSKCYFCIYSNFCELNQ
jgi:hypothetical protein